MAVDLDAAIAELVQAEREIYEKGKERQREAIGGLNQLSEGEVVYFNSLWPESLEQAFDRIADCLKVSTRGTSIVLIAKISGSRIRVRRLADGGARGRLAEWKNLKIGQSDSLHEDLDSETEGRELEKARKTAMYLNGSKQGRFLVDVDGGAIRVTHAFTPLSPKEF